MSVFLSLLSSMAISAVTSLTCIQILLIRIFNQIFMCMCSTSRETHCVCTHTPIRNLLPHWQPLFLLLLLFLSVLFFVLNFCFFPFNLISFDSLVVSLQFFSWTQSIWLLSRLGDCLALLLATDLMWLMGIWHGPTENVICFRAIQMHAELITRKTTGNTNFAQNNSHSDANDFVYPFEYSA